MNNTSRIFTRLKYTITFILHQRIVSGSIFTALQHLNVPDFVILSHPARVKKNTPFGRCLPVQRPAI